MDNELKTVHDALVSDKQLIVSLKQELNKLQNEKNDLAKNLFLGIIKVLDSLESKEENLTEKYAGDDTASKIIRSYSSISKQLLNLLGQHGVTKIAFPENRLLVGFSKVIDTEPDPAKKDDTIICIVKNGYMRGKELIRAAELIVVRN
jgi:molecular chaperone GrpE (heat shock protein)